MNIAKLNVFARSKSASRKNVSEMYPSELKAFKNNWKPSHITKTINLKTKDHEKESGNK